jgi:hypothetical protein
VAHAHLGCVFSLHHPVQTVSHVIHAEFGDDRTFPLLPLSSIRSLAETPKEKTVSIRTVAGPTQKEVDAIRSSRVHIALDQVRATAISGNVRMLACVTSVVCSPK